MAGNVERLEIHLVILLLQRRKVVDGIYRIVESARISASLPAGPSVLNVPDSKTVRSNRFRKFRKLGAIVGHFPEATVKQTNRSVFRMLGKVQVAFLVLVLSVTFRMEITFQVMGFFHNNISQFIDTLSRKLNL
ncbi:MAG: hypothetical protein A2413_12270 [Treponema sp. RIFOXYC1_FULL_61_9]|nr:MAG: hypothetical protein A2413_12270 [Treponema sp. RIFOXYC1_FULL_61_9]